MLTVRIHTAVTRSHAMRQGVKSYGMKGMSSMRCIPFESVCSRFKPSQFFLRHAEVMPYLMKQRQPYLFAKLLL